MQDDPGQPNSAQRTDDADDREEAAGSPGASRTPTRSWSPATSPDAPEQTGGADAVPMTPADDGLAGRDDQSQPVEPPASS
jgi:hypothetical protein